MLFATLSQSSTYQDSLQHATWKKILAWLTEHAASATDGEHEIDGRHVYAIASNVETMPENQAVFESHKKYIDLHYCISGGEKIAYTPISALKPKTEYDNEKDYTLYETTIPGELLTMTPDTFAIFMPQDGHMPKISDGLNKQVRKIVVKIHLDAVK